MAKNIFKRLSVEDNEYDIPENHFEIEDVIDSDSASDEVNDLAKSVKEDTLSLDNADKVIDELSGVVENNNNLLESSEPIETSAVIVAQESLKLAKRILKVKDADLDLMPSTEAIKDDARTSLVIANEGIIDFVKKLVQSIKLIFIKIGVWIKRIITKLRVIFNMSVSRAESLKKRLKNVKSAETKPFTEDEVHAIGNSLAILILFKQKHFKTDEHEVLNMYLELITSTDVPNKLADNIYKILEQIIAITKKDMVEDSDVDKLRELIVNSTNSATYGNPLLKGLGNFIETDHGLNIDKLEKSVHDFNILPIRLDGTNVRGIGYMLPKTNKALTVYDKLLKTDIMSMDASLDKKVITHFIIDVPTKDSLMKVLDAVITSGKKTSDYASAIDKHIDKLTTDIDKLYKTDFEDKFGFIARKSLIAVRKLTTHSFIESILGQVAGTKAVLKYCELSVKKYN